MSQILTLLNNLQSTSSRLEKEAILRSEQDNALLKRVIDFALSPYIQFYIRKIPAYMTDAVPTRTLDKALDDLTLLSNRTVTGHDGIDWLTDILETLPPDDAQVIERIIQKDLKCGVSDSTVNKIWPGIVADFPYMRCCLPKDAKLANFNWKAGVYSQVKADGMFANINVFADGNVTILSRSGSVFPMEKFADLEQEIRSKLLPDTQTHGEVLVMVDGAVAPREIGNGIINSVLKGGDFASNEVPTLLLWDQIPQSSVVSGGQYNTPYDVRLRNLTKQASDSTMLKLIDTRIVHNMEEAMIHYGEVLAVGGEGTILKDCDAIWKDTTSKQQVKLKLEVTVDLKIVGFTEGKGKNADTFGSITCESCDGELVVNVSGFKDKKQRGILTRAEIHEIRDTLVGTVMSVTSNNIMPPTKTNPKYSLFLPRFAEFRTDKVVADSLQQIKDQFANAVKIK